MGNWEGAVTQRGEADGVRYRHAAWLHDGARMVMVSDAEGEEFLELHREDPLAPVDRFTELDLGRVLELEPAPKDDRVAVCNHRNELLIVDVTDREVQRVDVSEHLMIADIDWSPDGRYLAYAFARSQHESVIKIYDSRAQESHVVTPPMRWDTDPVFGPEGKHLYFIGRRELDPVYDSIHFDLGFPRAGRPYVVLLQSDLRSPFLPQPEPEEEAESAKPASGGANGSEGSDDAGASESSGSGPGGAEGSSAAPEIAFRGIEDRVLAFPVSVATYGAPAALSNKLLYTRYPIRGTLEEKPEAKEGPAADAALVAFDFKTQSEETLVPGITSYRLAADRKTLVYRAGDGLRVVRAGEKPDEKAAGEGPGRKSGWVDLSRVRISVSPPAEWRQMYREAWRLQRDNFWNASMSDVDWEEVYRRYLPLLDRVSTRVEFSDLMWEMQGELGTSHAYEMGGDYPQRPNYRLGFLAADVAFDADRGLWRITSIVRGDPAHEKESSPLARGGAQVAENSTLLAIDGRQADGRSSPGELLVNKADTEVALTVGDADGGNPRTVSVKPLDRELPARYREWVEANRRAVHEATEGRAGYIHIPDMAPTGYAEFHRSFLPEIDREGLVVDVRFNRGGHVSNLLLEKLARRRLAYVVSRWFGTEPWPDDSPAGPMVALTNEMSGSDGDIFSHSFKLMELGPLIGKRTWGGVVGIWPRQPLVDRTLTSQPEFSFWFTDVGWQVENYGTDPDIPVEIAPQDYAAGRDPQLERAIQEVQTRIEQHVAPKPDLSTRPTRTVPRLPRRG
jgi:tricorn protease